MKDSLQRYALVRVTEARQQGHADQHAVVQEVKKHAGKDAATAYGKHAKDHAKDKRRQRLKDIHVIERKKEAADQDGGPHWETAPEPAQNETPECQLFTDGREKDVDDEIHPPESSFAIAQRTQLLHQWLAFA